MARVVKEKEYTERRNAILDVTQRLIYSKGYDRMAIQDILEELQISKGAFYHYFDSKQALLEALLERMTEEAKRVLLPVTEDPALPFLEKFQSFFTTLGRWKTTQKGFVIGIMSTWYADDNAIVRQKARLLLFKEVTPLLTEIIWQGIREGTLINPYPDQIGMVILAMLNDFSANLGELLFTHDLDHDTLLQQMESINRVYTDTLERILGIPGASLQLVDLETLKEWALLIREGA